MTNRACEQHHNSTLEVAGSVLPPLGYTKQSFGRFMMLRLQIGLKRCGSPPSTSCFHISPAEGRNNDQTKKLDDCCAVDLHDGACHLGKCSTTTRSNDPTQ